MLIFVAMMLKKVKFHNSTDELHNSVGKNYAIVFYSQILFSKLRKIQHVLRNLFFALRRKLTSGINAKRRSFSDLS